MILCCGEALIDMIPGQIAEGETGYVPHTGGAIFNTAIALGRLGAEVGMLSGVSNDSFGTLLAETLEQNGVDTAYLIRSDRLTTLAIVHLNDGQATYAFYDESSAGRMIATRDLPKLGAEITTLYFGGISLVNPPAADAYATLLKAEHSQRIVMIDPNIRPGFITDEVAYRARLDGMLRHADIVKVSDEDLVWITGKQGGVEAQAQHLQRTGPRFIIVTLGDAGALLFGPDGTQRVPAVAANVVDTVGAGDTFNAGFLAALANMGADKNSLVQMTTADLLPALTLGARVAALTVSRAGANPPFLSELEP